MKLSKHTIRSLTPKATNFPLLILLIASTLCASSYLLAGWLMRPIGDDYGSILAYHTGGIHWLTSLVPTVLTGGGRYAQTVISVTIYGALGQKGLQLTAFLGVGLFLLASYLAIIAWHKRQPFTPFLSRAQILAGSMIVFLFYTMISVTYPWVRGEIDNTFQDILWLPGYMTYTLPYELLVIAISLTAIHYNNIMADKKWWGLLFIAALFIGTFSEITPLAYTEALCLIGIYIVIKNGLTRKALWSTASKARPFIIIGCGLLFGLLLNYLSPATSQRRAMFNEQATLTQIIAHAGTMTGKYFSGYVVRSTAHNHSAIAFIVVASMAVGLITLWHTKAQRKHTRTIKSLLLLSAFSLIMATSSVFICFLVVMKGYGIQSYLVPRFEITYNIWIVAFLICVGALGANLIHALLTRTQTVRYIPLVCSLFGLLLLADMPHVLQQITGRFQTVAVYSASWQAQDSELRNDATRHQATATVPVIDIGDSYNFDCTDSSGKNWLGNVKQQYYHVPHICSNQTKP